MPPVSDTARFAERPCPRGETAVASGPRAPEEGGKTTAHITAELQVVTAAGTAVPA